MNNTDRLGVLVLGDMVGRAPSTFEIKVFTWDSLEKKVKIQSDYKTTYGIHNLIRQQCIPINCELVSKSTARSGINLSVKKLKQSRLDIIQMVASRVRLLLISKYNTVMLKDYEACCLMQAVLKEFDIASKIIKGYCKYDTVKGYKEHIWLNIEYNRSVFVVDITADQFNPVLKKKYPEVYIESLAKLGYNAHYGMVLSNTDTGDTEHSEIKANRYTVNANLDLNRSKLKADAIAREEKLRVAKLQPKSSYLYHATYLANIDSIRKLGLGAIGKSNWDGNPDVRNLVYMDENMDCALDFAESADAVDDDTYSSGIIVLRARTRAIIDSGATISKDHNTSQSSEEYTAWKITPLVPLEILEVLCNDNRFHALNSVDNTKINNSAEEYLD